MDFSPESKKTITYQDASSWIPRLELGPHVWGAMFQGYLFACDRLSKCKYLPLGHSQWLDAPNYEVSYRSWAIMTVVDDNVMISGGISSVSGKHNLLTFQATEMAANLSGIACEIGAGLTSVFNSYKGGNLRKKRLRPKNGI